MDMVNAARLAEGAPATGRAHRLWQRCADSMVQFNLRQSGSPTCCRATGAVAAVRQVLSGTVERLRDRTELTVHAAGTAHAAGGSAGRLPDRPAARPSSSGLPRRLPDPQDDRPAAQGGTAAAVSSPGPSSCWHHLAGAGLAGGGRVPAHGAGPRSPPPSCRPASCCSPSTACSAAGARHGDARPAGDEAHGFSPLLAGAPHGEAGASRRADAGAS